MSRCPRPRAAATGAFPDQADGVGAARQHADAEHDVGDPAAGAPGSVRAHR
ncbi:MAG: hypothetical protein ABSF03_32950 [Streptosporangiaceae bacterium]